MIITLLWFLLVGENKGKPTIILVALAKDSKWVSWCNAMIYWRKQTPFEYYVYSSININLDKEQQTALHHWFPNWYLRTTSWDSLHYTPQSFPLPYISGNYNNDVYVVVHCAQNHVICICLCLLSVNVYYRVTIE